MAELERIGPADLDSALASLPHWRLREGRLHRELRFSDFPEAFAFLTRVALLAERAGHHPDWANSWNRVTLDLTTHDAGGVTAKDVALAHEIEAIAPR